ncbi:MAG: 30S ribosomal protein S19 [Cyanobacteria bacterium P01_A01_bin.68]
MTRSVWKGPFVDPSLLKKVKKHSKTKRSGIINTRSRRSYIIPSFIGLTFGVYNGRKYIPVLVSVEMVGQKLGEYSPTRTYYGHGADKKAKRN